MQIHEFPWLFGTKPLYCQPTRPITRRSRTNQVVIQIAITLGDQRIDLVFANGKYANYGFEYAHSAYKQINTK
jgi:hypothetical protein